MVVDTLNHSCISSYTQWQPINLYHMQSILWEANVMIVSWFTDETCMFMLWSELRACYIKSWLFSWFVTNCTTLIPWLHYWKARLSTKVRIFFFAMANPFHGGELITDPITRTHLMSICFKLLSFSQSYFCKREKSMLQAWWMCPYVFDLISWQL
jgi:hypothetical protein